MSSERQLDIEQHVDIQAAPEVVFEGIIRSDGPVVVGVTTFLVVVFMISNLLVDVMYAWLDPRIRYE